MASNPRSCREAREQPKAQVLYGRSHCVRNGAPLFATRHDLARCFILQFQELPMQTPPSLPKVVLAGKPSASASPSFRVPPPPPKDLHCEYCGEGHLRGPVALKNHIKDKRSCAEAADARKKDQQQKKAFKRMRAVV